MQETDLPTDAQERAADVPLDEPSRAWEEIEPGRFMPRRVRGSFQGGKLGWAFVVPSGSDGSNK